MPDAIEQERDGSAIRALVSFFTIKHFDLIQADIDEMERNFHLAPIVGAIYGAVMMLVVLLALAVYRFGYNGLWTLAIPALCLACAFFGSKFLHFDGLTDFGDGMVVSGSREDHVRALKDTLVGAGGVGVAVTVVLLAFCSYLTVPIIMMLSVIPMSEVFLKVAMVFAAAYGEPSNGMAARQVSQATKNTAINALVVGAVMAAILMVIGTALSVLLFDPSIGDLLLHGVLALILGIAVASCVGWAVARISNRTFGFVNGDVLGATNELARPAVLLTIGLVLSLLPPVFR